MNANASTRPTEELDLAIPNLDDPAAYQTAEKALRDLPGIIASRLHSRGAFISYDPRSITKDTIVAALQRNHLRASVFQDSASGQTGSSSQ